MHKPLRSAALLLRGPLLPQRPLRPCRVRLLPQISPQPNAYPMSTRLLHTERPRGAPSPCSLLLRRTKPLMMDELLLCAYYAQALPSCTGCSRMEAA